MLLVKANIQPKVQKVFGEYLGLNIVTFTLRTYQVSLEIPKITLENWN